MRYLVLLLLTGCSMIAQETSVTLPGGEVYRVRCQHDARVEFQQGDTRVMVDNRGQPSVMRDLLNVVTLGLVKKD